MERATFSGVVVVVFRGVVCLGCMCQRLVQDLLVQVDLDVEESLA